MSVSPPSLPAYGEGMCVCVCVCVPACVCVVGRYVGRRLHGKRSVRRCRVYTGSILDVPLSLRGLDVVASLFPGQMPSPRVDTRRPRGGVTLRRG